jgi:hypothetical protein
VGQGNITIDIFYTVANETNFFIRTMKLPSAFKAPKMEEVIGK